MNRRKPAKVQAAPLAIGAPELTCYPLWPTSPALTPAKAERDWMDMTSERYAYRCIPLSIANASGWEIALPFGFEAAWYGGDDMGAIQFRAADERVRHHVTSHFGHGVITFHTGWLFRTPPGWAVWTRGAPNSVKDGIVALDGLVETDWLPFPFTMNWHFTRPGRVKFAKGEPFCFITLAEDKALETFELVQKRLEADDELRGQYEAWRKQRDAFNKALFRRDPEAMKESWQRFYFRGELPDETGPAPKTHTNKRRLKPLRLGS